MKMKKNKNKIIAIILCICITVPTFSVGVISFAKANPDIIKLPFVENAPISEMNISDVKQTTDTDMKSIEGKSISVEIPSEGTKEIYKGTKKTIVAKGTEKSNFIKNTGTTDRYNLDKDDIEEMLNSGYSIKQIFEADEAGNRIQENPESLLERGKQEKKELKDIEKEIKSERKQKQFDELKVKYPKEYEQLKTEKLKDNEITNLLIFYDLNDVKSITELAGEYGKNGDKALVKALKAKTTTLSTTKMKEYGIAAGDTNGLSDDILSRMEELSKKTNKPVKELIKGYRDARNKLEVK